MFIGGLTYLHECVNLPIVYMIPIDILMKFLFKATSLACRILGLMELKAVAQQQ